ncbi:MAG: lipoate--protein ligase [Marinilabilia sp.]
MQKTFTIISETTDPAFNLAAEEVLMRHHKENILFFYINAPSIIVGKHQNTLAEVNLQYLEENNIPVYRRLSGGGTVYHDHGNINYCIIENGEPGKLVDFVRATTPVVKALKSYGLDARHGKRNDLLAGYKKISGNACHVYKSRTMHHGTLLFNSDLKHLTEALKAQPMKFKDKSVKSVRSEVVNIGSLISSEDTPGSFLLFMAGQLKEIFGAEEFSFTTDDLKQIEKLSEEKYNTWKWNYGYSPVYEFSKRFATDQYKYSSKLRVEKGIITRADIRSDHPDQEKIEMVSLKVKGSLHEKNAIKQALSDFDKEMVSGVINSLF